MESKETEEHSLLLRSKCITRKQLAALSGGRIEKVQYSNPLGLGTPVNWCGAGYGTKDKIVYYYCIKEENNPPLPESTEDEFVLCRYPRRDGIDDIQNEMKWLRDHKNPQQKSIAIFWEPKDQPSYVEDLNKNASSSANSKAKGVCYIGHWSVEKVVRQKFEVCGHWRCGKIRFRLDRYDDHFDQIIEMCHLKTHDEIRNLDFSFLQDNVDEVKTPLTKGEDSGGEDVPPRQHEVGNTRDRENGPSTMHKPEGRQQRVKQEVKQEPNAVKSEPSAVKSETSAVKNETNTSSNAPDHNIDQKCTRQTRRKRNNQQHPGVPTANGMAARPKRICEQNPSNPEWSRPQTRNQNSRGESERTATKSHERSGRKRRTHVNESQSHEPREESGKRARQGSNDITRKNKIECDEVASLQRPLKLPDSSGERLHLPKQDPNDEPNNVAVQDSGLWNNPIDLADSSDDDDDDKDETMHLPKKEHIDEPSDFSVQDETVAVPKQKPNSEPNHDDQPHETIANPKEEHHDGSPPTNNPSVVYKLIVLDERHRVMNPEEEQADSSESTHLMIHLSRPFQSTKFCHLKRAIREQLDLRYRVTRAEAQFFFCVGWAQLSMKQEGDMFIAHRHWESYFRPNRATDGTMGHPYEVTIKIK